MISIEICTNREWIGQQLSGLGLEDFANRDEAVDKYLDVARDLARENFPGSEVKFKTAGGNRNTYHGWNGAWSYKYKSGVFASFSDLTDAQKDSLSQADEYGRIAAQEIVDRATESAEVDAE